MGVCVQFSVCARTIQEELAVALALAVVGATDEEAVVEGVEATAASAAGG